MTRIFVENNELDLTADITNQLTFSIDDIRNLDSKTTSFSKTIVIPGTQRNNRIFGNIYELSNANFPGGDVNAFYDFDASKSAQARIEINGLQAMKGTLRLLSITVDRGMVEYEVALFGELGGFISSIGISKLEDLDFSAYDHEWTIGNITNTFDDPGIFQSPTYTISGPYSTDKNPTVYRIRLDINASSLYAYNRIRVSGSASNNRIFTVAEVFFNRSALPPYTYQTDIYVFEPVVNEGGSNLTIEVLDKDGYGYVYPLIDYGFPTTSGYTALKDFNWRNYRPAFFVLEYMDKIITNAGYTWESRFMNSAFFRSLIIPNNDIGLEKRGFTEYLDISDTFQNYDFDVNYTYATIIQYIAFPTQTTLTNFTPSAGDTIFTYTSAGNINTKLKFDFAGSLIKPRYSTVSISITVNDNSIATFTLDDPIKEYSDKIQGSIEQVLSLKQNDKVSVKIRYHVGSYYDWTGIQWLLKRVTAHTFLNLDSIRLTILNDPPGFIQYTSGELLSMNNTIPKNVYQKDFFISIMKMFNLMVVERKDKTKHLVIEPYIDFYQTGLQTYIDWSYKVNREKPIMIKPMSEINARIYEFKYKEDSDEFNETYKKQFNQVYGNRIFDNKLEFAKDSQSVEIIFSPSVLVGYDGYDKIYPAIYKINGADKEPIAHNIRIMQIKRIQGVDSYSIFNDTYSVDLTKYIYAGHLNDPYDPYIDINWGATKKLFFTLTQGALSYNMFNNFYSPYMAEIMDKDSRLVTCEMKLSEKDIFQLDFSRFVMIDGVLFRVMKIIDWSEGSLCKVDLLRVINTTYIPDTPASAKVFRMRYDDLNAVDTMLGGDRAVVNDWNAFFGLTGSNVFSSCYVENNDIILLGNVKMGIDANLFKGNTNIIGLWDNIGAIGRIYTNAFQDSSIKVFHSISCVSMELTAFNNSALYEIITPNLIELGDQVFLKCYYLINIDFSSLQTCGTSLGSDDVFQDISGNIIDLKLNQNLYFQNDDDINSLISNNTVNLQLI